MTQPSPYNRAFNFSNWQAANPTSPVPAGSLDEEFSRIKAVIDQIRTSIAYIQRDDYALANRSVGFDQLKTEIEIGINPPAPWTTATNYIERDTVFETSKFYICEESHVSGTFATDLAAGKWSLIADLTFTPPASSVTYDNSESGMTAETVQAAIDELLEAVSAAGVATFNGRSGAVVAVAGDYDADEIDFDATGLASTDATDLQEAIADLDAALAGKAASVHGHGIGDISGLAALVPLTTRGDTLYRGASANQRLAKGSEYQVMVQGANDPSWRTLVTQFSSVIASPQNKDYTIGLDMQFAGEVFVTTTKAGAGTAIATFKIGSTALGGTANSVSTIEQQRSHTTSNVFAVGDDIVLTVSGVSSCTDLAYTVGVRPRIAA